MAIKNTDAFLADLITEIQKMKDDPEKDTLARVLTMVFRVAGKHNDRAAMKRSFLTFAMGADGIDPEEMKVLQKWSDETEA